MLAITRGELPADPLTIETNDEIRNVLLQCWSRVAEQRPRMIWCLLRLSKWAGKAGPVHDSDNRGQQDNSVERSIRGHNHPLHSETLKAVEHFQLAIDHKKEVGEAPRAGGPRYFAQDDLQKAFESFQRALHSLPTPKVRVVDLTLSHRKPTPILTTHYVIGPEALV